MAGGLSTNAVLAVLRTGAKYKCEKCGCVLVYEKPCPCGDKMKHSEICCGEQMKKIH